jgi:pimeloyl-ACP methyl ester carboxylesterase
VRQYQRLPRRYARLGRWRIAYALIGRGPAVLLLHGLGGSADFWQPLVARLAGRYTLVCPDQIGFGLSEKPAVRYTPSLHLAAVAAVLQDAQVLHLHAAVGHSAGGITAIELMASGLAHAERLVLAAVAYASPRYDLRTELVRSRYFRLLTRSCVLAHLDHMAFKALWPLIRRVPLPMHLEGPRAGLMDHTVASYFGTAEELLFRTDLDPFVARLRGTPTLLLYGDADRTVAPDSAERFQQMLPDAEAVAFTGGHYGVITEAAPSVVRWLGEDR